MDQNEMKLVAHFKVLFAKETGNKIDLIKFSNDNGYAKQLLERAATSENEELLVIAMQLLQRRGLIEKPAQKQEQARGSDIDEKYKGRLR